MRSLSVSSVHLFDQSRLAPILVGVGVAAVVLALLVPVLDAGPAPLTSDESLYLSEAYNIAKGVGPEYTSGDIVNHRAPLFPALLAAPIKLAGGDSAAAYLVPKLIVAALVVATFLLGRELFGTMQGIAGALLVASNAFLRWLGTTLFLDGTETLFLLLFLFASIKAFRTESTGWFAAAGVMLGLAFLTKETAVLWLPLPVAFALLSSGSRNRQVALGLLAYCAIAGAALALWWAWVYLATDRIYFYGEPDARLAALVIGAIAVSGVGALAWYALRKIAPDSLELLASWAGLALAGAFGVTIFAFLELTSWSFPRDYASSVPDYLWNVVAGNSQPWPLLAIGAGWLIYRSRTHDGARLLTLALALFLPFALWVANRYFSYRDLLPMLYIACIAGGAFAVAAVDWASARAGLLAPAVAIAALVVLAIAQTQHLVDTRLPYDDEAVASANWDNPLARDTAAWIGEHVPADATLMSSRLYATQLYVLNEGRNPIVQLPTVRAEPRSGASPRVEPVTTLFRWEDHRLEAIDGDPRWLYLQRYPEKLYYVGLSEVHFLGELRDREIDYLVLTGVDAGFSTFAFLDYVEGHPAFEPLYSDVRDDFNAVRVYRVDRGQLAPRTYRAAVTAETIEPLRNELGLATSDEVAAAIDPDGIVID